MRIKYFKQFVNESYLKGGKQPLYHFTNTNRLFNILEDDMLKTSIPARQSHGHDKSIALTRSIDFTQAHGSGALLELDQDLLLKHNYKSKPVDEIGWIDGVPNPNAKDSKYQKSYFPNVKSGTRGSRHNIENLPKKYMLETEFEERIFKDIKELGKYLISINIDENKLHNYMVEDLYNYIQKYPHIEIYTYDNSNRRVKKNITETIKQYKDSTEKVIK